MRLGGRGLPAPQGAAGDLYAIVTLVMPKTLTEGERKLYEELAKVSAFNPRRHFDEEIARG